MSLDLNFDQNLLLPQIEVSSSVEALKKMSQLLYRYGYVKHSYLESIIEREKKYPTGLPSDKPMVAIPHTNFELVNKTTFCIATLSQPVEFECMENSSKRIPIEIIIMLAIREPKGQIEMLQKIVDIIQNQSIKNKLMQAKDKIELLDVLTQIF